MTLLNLPFDGQPHRYLVFHPKRLPDTLTLASNATTQTFESMASSRFFLSQNGSLLAKVVPDKFDRRQTPGKWLLRDYVEKRWLGQSDARKEFRCARILQRIGLQTPFYYGWGVSLDPANSNASLLLMERITDARLGGDAFKAMDEPARLHFIDRLCAEVASIARHGYAVRDLHHNNLMLREYVGQGVNERAGESSTLIWLDTHLRRLPRSPKARERALQRSLTAEKLGGEAYRQRAEQRLGELLVSFGG